jgi:predicted RNase H-like HicB family nuclease
VAVAGFLKQEEMSMADKLRFAVLIEQDPPGSNLSAYVPDLPGCITTGRSLDEIKRNLVEAVELHLHWMRKAGEHIPEPFTLADYVEIPNDPAVWAEGVIELEALPKRRRQNR